MTPLVSVIMCTYNSAPFLKRAVDSILDQTYPNIEFIICDDASTDDTFSYLNDSYGHINNVIIIKNENNRGLAHSLNKCLKICKGKYIARMDDDDFSHPNRIEKQIDFLEMHPEYAIVGSLKNYFDENGIWGKSIDYGERTKTDIFRGFSFSHPTVIMRKDAIMKIGMYTDNFINRRSQDYDLWCKFYFYGYKGYVLDEILFDYYESTVSIKRRKTKYQFHKFIKSLIWFFKLKIEIKYISVPLKELAKCAVPNSLKFKLHKSKLCNE